MVLCLYCLHETWYAKYALDFFRVVNITVRRSLTHLKYPSTVFRTYKLKASLISLSVV